MINRHYKKGIALLLSGVMALSPLCMQNSYADVMKSYRESTSMSDFEKTEKDELLSQEKKEVDEETSEDVILWDDVSGTEEVSTPFYEKMDRIRNMHGKRLATYGISLMKEAT